MRRLSLLLGVGLLFSGAACSQKKPNQRDIRRNQELIEAEALRTEYQAVAGIYDGELVTAGGTEQKVVLNLNVQDVPENSEGSPDHILVPKFTGNLRVLIGDESAGEFVDAAIQNSEYFASKKQISIVVKNDALSSIIFNLNTADRSLSGTWTAPESGVSGTTVLRKRP